MRSIMSFVFLLSLLAVHMGGLRADGLRTEGTRAGTLRVEWRGDDWMRTEGLRAEGLKTQSLRTEGLRVERLRATEGRRLRLRGGGGGSELDLNGLNLDDVHLEKENCNLVMVGHVDAGKSTISGQILWLSGRIDQRTMEKYEKDSKALGMESWKYAWAMDLTETEREKGKTEEVGTATFETSKRRYTILDAPGHKSYVPSMITGATQADIALLVISARTGEYEAGFERGGQTREHAILVKTAGVKKLVAAINKMDDCGWDRERYESIQKEMKQFLKSVGFSEKEIVFVPIAGLSGANMKDPVSAKECPWYEGKPLFDILDGINIETKGADGPVRMPIHDRYREGETCLLGKLESGTISKGDKLLIMPAASEVVINSIWIESTQVDAVRCGELVKLKVKGVTDDQVQSGDVLVPAKTEVRKTTKFVAKVNIIECPSIYTAGFQCMLYAHTLEVSCTLDQVRHILDKKTGKPSSTQLPFLKQGQAAEVVIACESAIWIESYKDFPQLGRFVLRHDGETVAVGVVTETLED